MAQHDYVVANDSGAGVRADLNNALAAIVSINSGASAPSTTYAYMLWADTTNGVLKRRNAANSAWLVVRSLDEATVLSRSSNTLLDVSDVGKTIRATGSYTQTFDAVATLGDGWGIGFRVEAGATLTLDPNSTETIDGATTLAINGPASGWIVCNGSALYTVGLRTGGVIQRAYAEYATNADLSTAIPFDDTIPQNTEGTEIISQSFTPKSTTSRIRLRFQGEAAHGTAATSMGAALFRDSVANALAASTILAPGVGYIAPLCVEFEEASPGTSAVTYKVRVGPQSGTMRLNGQQTGRIYGGVMKSTLIIEEVE
jgi:hypothetical protein